jgi:hypothetical protein
MNVLNGSFGTRCRRASLPMPWSRAAIWPSGAMNAPYDEPAPMCPPYVASPDSTPAMASSQIPPMLRSRASGFAPEFRNPSGNPFAELDTDVEPSRSAAAASTAPPESLLRWFRTLPNASRTVIFAPGFRINSSGNFAGSTCFASYTTSRRGAFGRGLRFLFLNRSRAATSRSASLDTRGLFFSSASRTTRSASQ